MISPGDEALASAAPRLISPTLDVRAAAPLLAPARLILFGTSTCASCDDSAMYQVTCDNLCNTYLSGSFGYWLNMYAGDRAERFSSSNCYQTNNFGLSGDTVTNMATAARLRPLLAKIVPGRTIVVHQGGEDDISQGADYAPMEAALRWVWNRLLNAGAIVLFPTIFPRDGIHAFDRSQTQIATGINDFARRFASENGSRGFHVVDLDDIMVDPSQPGWAVREGYLQDGVHLSVIGGSACASAIAQVINRLVAPRPRPFLSAPDIYHPSLNRHGNLLANGVMEGDGGLLIGGALGTVPTGWTLDASCAGGASVVGATERLANGTTTAIIRISGLCQGGGEVSFSQILARSSDICAGDVLRARMRASIGANENITGLPIRLATFEDGRWCYHIGGSPFGIWTLPAAGFAFGDFASIDAPDRVVAATPDEVQVSLIVMMPDLGRPFPVSATVQIADAEVRKVIEESSPVRQELPIPGV